MGSFTGVPRMGFDPNDPKFQNFMGQILRMIINSGIHSLMWRLGTFWLVLLIGAAIAGVVYFKLY
jgi:hypothetical protein